MRWRLYSAMICLTAGTRVYSHQSLLWICSSNAVNFGGTGLDTIAFLASEVWGGQSYKLGPWQQSCLSFCHDSHGCVTACLNRELNLEQYIRTTATAASVLSLCLHGINAGGIQRSSHSQCNCERNGLNCLKQGSSRHTRLQESCWQVSCLKWSVTSDVIEKNRCNLIHHKKAMQHVLHISSIMVQQWVLVDASISLTRWSAGYPPLFPILTMDRKLGSVHISNLIE